MKEWVENRCLSRGDGENGAGKRVSGMRLSAPEAEHEDGASALGVPAARGCVFGLHGSQVTWVWVKKIGFQNDIRGYFPDSPLPPTCYYRTSRLS